MHTTHQDNFTARHTAATGATLLVEALMGAFKAQLESYKRDRRARLALVALAGMDAHLLRDIGADRSDLERLVREGRD